MGYFLNIHLKNRKQPIYVAYVIAEKFPRKRSPNAFRDRDCRYSRIGLYYRTKCFKSYERRRASEIDEAGKAFNIFSRCGLKKLKDVFGESECFFARSTRSSSISHSDASAVKYPFVGHRRIPYPMCTKSMVVSLLGYCLGRQCKRGSGNQRRRTGWGANPLFTVERRTG